MKYIDPNSTFTDKVRDNLVSNKFDNPSCPISDRVLDVKKMSESGSPVVSIGFGNIDIQSSASGISSP